MTKARTHSRNAFPSPSSWKYVASLRKSMVMVRFSRVGLAAVPMCHPQVIRSRQLIRHDGGNASKSQDNREGLRALPLKAMECGISCAPPGHPRLALPLAQYRHAPADVLSWVAGFRAL